ncbi:MAG TPA: FMN-dependent NADH-azoreductase [Steroidobacteraceae bacterium]|jgi:FMN-dependent NADH-azoreductase
MTTLLKIQTSLSGSTGQSSQLADRFAQQWLASNPGGRIVTRDLTADAVPHLTAERFQSFLAKPEARTPQQQEIADYSDALIAELKAADVIVFAVPMYNFSVPSTLRAYFDHIARIGVTFQYTAEGPRGLVQGKKVYVFITRGGVYPEAADTQTPYLRQFLGFIGMTDVQFIHAEGLSTGDEPREKSLAAARHTIAKLQPAPAALAA